MQKAGQFAFKAGVSRRGGVPKPAVDVPNALLSGSKRIRSDIVAEAGEVAAANVQASSSAAAVPLELATDLEPAVDALTGVSMSDNGDLALVLALRAVLARAESTGVASSAVSAAARHLIEDFVTTEMPAAASSASVASTASSAPLANPKNSKLRAREQVLETSLVLLRKEAAEWRACAAKYLAPAPAPLASAASGSSREGSDDDEEDDELAMKYSSHAALGGALAGGINSVFMTIDSLALALTAAGNVIDAAPAAITKASHILRQEGLAGILDSTATDAKGLLRRVASENNGASRTPGKGKSVAAAAAAAAAASASKRVTVAAAPFAAAPSELRHGGGRPSVMPSGTPNIIKKIQGRR